MAFIDTAEYPKEKVPEAALSRAFVTHEVPVEDRLKIVAAGFKSCAVFRSLGSTEEKFEDRVKRACTWVDDPEDEAGSLLKISQLVSVWKDAGVASSEASLEGLRLAEDPLKIPRISSIEHGLSERRFASLHQEMMLGWGFKPHFRFVERFRRDWLVERIMKFYEICEIRLETDTIVQTPGISKDVASVLKATMMEDSQTIAGTEDGRRRIHALFITAERQGVCPMTVEGGPLKYLRKLQEHCDQYPGLEHLLSADRKIRKEIYTVQQQDPSKIPNLSNAIEEVLTNRRHLWSEAAQAVMTSRVADWSRGTPEPGTPAKRERELSADGFDDDAGSPLKPKKKKMSQKDRLVKKLSAVGFEWPQAGGARGSPPRGGAKGGAKGAKGGAKGAAKDKGPRGKAPPDEWRKLLAAASPARIGKGGKKVCIFHNSTIGCKFGDQCLDLHECLICPDQTHKYAVRHA